MGLVVFLTILGYAYFLLKTQEAQGIQKILGTAGMFSDTLKKSTKYSMLKYQPEAMLKIIEAAGGTVRGGVHPHLSIRRGPSCIPPTPGKSVRR